MCLIKIVPCGTWVGFAKVSASIYVGSFSTNCPPIIPPQAAAGDREVGGVLSAFESYNFWLTDVKSMTHLSRYNQMYGVGGANDFPWKLRSYVRIVSKHIRMLFKSCLNVCISIIWDNTMLTGFNKHEISSHSHSYFPKLSGMTNECFYFIMTMSNVASN